MEQERKTIARNVLAQYIAENNCRRTAERFAILDTVYEFDAPFCIDDLTTKMTEANFHVSIATVYNAMALFSKLSLVVSSRRGGTTFYEGCVGSQGKCYWQCTVCGKRADFQLPQLEAQLKTVRWGRFRREYHTLCVYGICPSCRKRGAKKRNGNKSKESNT